MFRFQLTEYSRNSLCDIKMWVHVKEHVEQAFLRWNKNVFNWRNDSLSTLYEEVVWSAIVL